MSVPSFALIPKPGGMLLLTSERADELAYSPHDGRLDCWGQGDISKLVQRWMDSTKTGDAR